MSNKSTWRRIFVLSSAIATLALTGCASIVSGTNQVVTVEARHKTEMIIGAKCQLDNGKGTYYVTSPGTVTVNRAYADMNVKCEKENLPPGLATVKSTTKPMAFGNIIFGGVVGAAIDAGSGAAYDYPTMISVMMGESVMLPAPASPREAAPASAPAPTAQAAPTPASTPQPVAQK